MTKIKEWWYSKRIEDFPAGELAERFHLVMNLDFWKKVVAMPYIGQPERVSYRSDEVIALCPATGIVDLYSVEIIYIPGDTIPELKSLKFYLMEYKDIPISHEHLASKIYQDIKRVINPPQLQVNVNVAVRGGILTRITVGKEVT